jgi:asparagine synthase (glutamine-hydrolysing)
MFRYLACAWNARSEGAAQRVDYMATRLCCGRWAEVFNLAGLRVWCVEAAGVPHIKCNRGIALGAIVKRFENVGAPIMQPTPCELERWLLERTIIDRAFGNYVAFAVTEGAIAIDVFREPTATLPCLHLPDRELHLFASNIEDLRDLNIAQLEISNDYLQQRLIGETSVLRLSALTPLGEVIGGEHWRLSFDGASAPLTRNLLWRPAQFASDRHLLIRDAETASDTLRQAMLYGTRAGRLETAPAVLRLSGGLDSSIVLGALAHHRATQLLGYTYFDPNGTRSELRWPRMAAAFHKIENIEVPFAPEQVDLSDVLDLCASHAPISTLPYLQRAGLERELCTQLGATTVWTGLGGDSALCRDSVDLVAIEAFRPSAWLQPSWWRLCARVARHTELSIWEVIAAASTAHNRRAAPFNASSAFTRLANPEALRPTQRPITIHPWLTGTEHLPTLRRRLGALLQPSEFYDLSIARDETAPHVVSPLSSRPVIEACLRIPSTLHFERGIERGLARRAFACELPPEIRARCWKDRAPGFLERIVHHNHTFVREFLLDGFLVRDHWLSAPAIEAALGATAARSQVSSIELLNHLDLEAWIRHWR